MPPLPSGTTVADCLAAQADLAAAPDQLVYDCAISCLLGACVVYDATECTTCACPAYVRSSEICSASGECSSPLDGTGCIGLGFYSNHAPFTCPSSLGVLGESACMLRVLQAGGYCDAR